jgi:hypothetical protein
MLFDEICTLHTTGVVHVGDSSSKVVMSDLRASVTIWFRHCTAWLALLGSLKSARASPYSPHISFGQNILDKQTMWVTCNYENFSYTQEQRGRMAPTSKGQSNREKSE